MGFLKRPKVPTPPPAPTPASNPLIARDSGLEDLSTPYGAGSLISTSSSGLKRKASVMRTSLIGG